MQTDKLLPAHLGAGEGERGAGASGTGPPRAGRVTTPLPNPELMAGPRLTSATRQGPRDQGCLLPSGGGYRVGSTWFMTSTSAAWVQKQSCTETKVRPFLPQDKGLL